MKKLILLVLINLSLFVYANSKWEKCKNQMSYYQTLSIAIDGNNIFAGAGSITGTNGIYLSTDNGDTWTRKDSTAHIPYTIAIKDSDIYAGGQGGYINSTHYAGFVASTDYGNSWREVKNGLPDTTVATIAINGDKIFACTAVGLYLSTNKGISWVVNNNGLPNTGIVSILINGDSLFVGTYERGIFLSTDDGDSWAEKNNGLEYKYYPKLCKKGNCIFAGTMSGIFLSTDGSNSWARRDSGLTENRIQTIYAIDNMIFAGTVNMGLAYSTNNGDNWIQDSELLNQWVVYIAESADYIFVGDMASGIYRAKISDFKDVKDNSMLQNQDLMIFPIPATVFIEISGFSHTLQAVVENPEICIYNSMGEIVLKNPTPAFTEGKGIRIDVSSLPPGLYFARVGDKVSKFVKI